jgi:FMN-dependent oxidoreductase (nitrilotriacetate monooxygenase family)
MPPAHIQTHVAERSELPMTRQLHLNVNINDVGKHPSAWRVVDDSRAFCDVDYFCSVARLAERGTFDAIFLSDAPYQWEAVPTKPWQSLDPIVVLSAVAKATSHIGLVATASTTFNHPYNLARRFASLDHVSRGRAAWNIVTTFPSPAVAANFGLEGEMPDHDARYGRADEFVHVVLQLWDSWEGDGLPADKVTGDFADARRIHAIDHRGDHFSVRGPLQVPRTPQGRPILVQAGASLQGRALSAKYADIMFTPQKIFDGARRDYDAIQEQVRRVGRDPDQVRVIPGFFPVVGSTEREAYARRAELDAFLDLDVEVDRMSELLGVPLATDDLDRQLPQRPSSRSAVTLSVGVVEATWRFAQSEQLTLRELILRNGGAHRQLVGTPEQIADDIERWFVNHAADGFNLNFTHLPDALEPFVDHVVPLLRHRGIFRHEYEGTTLRENLGLSVPENRHTARRRSTQRLAS